MKLTYEQFKKYIEDNGVTDARTTEDWKAIPKGTLIKFGLQPDGTITSWESFLEGQKQYEYIFCAQWIAAWTVYKGLFEVEDKQKELRISVKTQEEWNAVVRKMLDDPNIGKWRTGNDSVLEHLFSDHEKDAVLYSEEMDNYKISCSTKKYYDDNFPNIPLQSAQEYLGYDPNEKLTVNQPNISIGDDIRNPNDILRVQGPMLDGYVYTYNGEIFKDKRSTLNKYYGKSFYDVFLEEIKAYKYTMELNPINQLTKPKGNKYMSIISNAFKSKENKALEYFNLGTTETLSERGRQEFIDFLWETLKEEKKSFLNKIVEAYKEDKE